MYTTIRMLQTNNACIPGFTRTVTFFGTGPSMRDTPIPLWALTITNCGDDFEWALQNACIIDSAMYKEFRSRTILGHFRYLYWRNSRRPASVKNPAAKLAIEEAATVCTAEQAEQYIEKYKDYVLSGNNWFNDLYKLAWTSPKEYISNVWNCFQECTSDNFDRSAFGAEHKQLFTEYGEDVSTRTYYPISYKLSHAEGFAALCLNTRNVYDELLKFAVQHSVFNRRRRGSGNVVLSTNAEGKFVASVEVNDPKSIFQMLRLTTMQSASKSELLETIHESFTEHADALSGAMEYRDVELEDLNDPERVAEVQDRLDRRDGVRGRVRRVSATRVTTDGDDDEPDDGPDA